MSAPRASVHSLDALEHFKAAFDKFGDQSRQVLDCVEIEIQRTLDWLEGDQMTFWTAEVRRREEAVTAAKVELNRARMMAFEDSPSCTDQVVALRKAKLRLEEAEETLKRLKQWCRVVREEVEEYRGRAQRLANLLEASLPQGDALLERMMVSIESYLAVAPAAAGPDAGASIAGPPASPSTAPSQGRNAPSRDAPQGGPAQCDAPEASDHNADQEAASAPRRP